jgi:hypothetical protein
VVAAGAIKVISVEIFELSPVRATPGAMTTVMQFPCTTASWARSPAFAILNRNERRSAVEVRMVSAAPSNEPADLARLGSRSTEAPAGVV